ncbi:MAG: hypothetical protein AAF335_04510 [Bacteroidota bacterium]
MIDYYKQKNKEEMMKQIGWNDLHKYVYYNNIKEIKKLLNEKLNDELKQYQVAQSLFAAKSNVGKEEKEKLKKEIENAARKKRWDYINDKDMLGRTCLHLAIQYKRKNIVNLLITPEKLRLMINLKDSIMEKECSFETGDIHAKDKQECTILHYMLYYHVYIEKLLHILKQPINQTIINKPDNQGKTPLDMAKKSNNKAMLKWLICVNKWTKLHKYAFDEDIDGMKKIGWKDINAQDLVGRTPLHIVLQYGNIEAEKHVYQYKIDSNSYSDSDSDSDSDSPVKTDSYLDSVKCLTRHGALLDIRDKDLRTPFHYVAKRNQMIMKVLFEKALFDMIQELKCAKDNYEKKLETNPLRKELWMKEKRKTEDNARKKCLDYISIKDRFGCTVFHEAAHSRNKCIMVFLLSVGKNKEFLQDRESQSRINRSINKKNKKGMTALDIAKKNRDKGIVSLLEAASQV